MLRIQNAGPRQQLTRFKPFKTFWPPAVSCTESIPHISRLLSHTRSFNVHIIGSPTGPKSANPSHLYMHKTGSQRLLPLQMSTPVPVDFSVYTLTIADFSSAG
jgi:hypothetical protein